MPNAWDVGSARLLESLGFDAVATTSSGFAATLGRHDQNVSLAELADHVAAISGSIEIPLSVDAEDGYSEEAGGLVETVAALAQAGASGISIEDYRPGSGILTIDEASERVGVYAEAAADQGITVTARAENHLYDRDDLADTIDRLRAYRSAGAHVLYAPGLTTATDIARVVTQCGGPVNALLGGDTPTVTEMRDLGVRRLSTGGSLALAAYGAAARGARELLQRGTSDYVRGSLTPEERDRAFAPR
jgi:2-methylisocitrate lyase-like PEP mutase family enzyme